MKKLFGSRLFKTILGIVFTLSISTLFVCCLFYAFVATSGFSDSDKKCASYYDTDSFQGIMNFKVMHLMDDISTLDTYAPLFEDIDTDTPVIRLFDYYTDDSVDITLDYIYNHGLDVPYTFSTEYGSETFFEADTSIAYYNKLSSLIGGDYVLVNQNIYSELIMTYGVSNLDPISGEAINKNFSASSYIYQNNDGAFVVYSPEDSLFYCKTLGWFDAGNGLLFNKEYLDAELNLATEEAFLQETPILYSTLANNISLSYEDYTAAYNNLSASSDPYNYYGDINYYSDLDYYTVLSGGYSNVARTYSNVKSASAISSNDAYIYYDTNSNTIDTNCGLVSNTFSYGFSDVPNYSIAVGYSEDKSSNLYYDTLSIPSAKSIFDNYLPYSDLFIVLGCISAIITIISIIGLIAATGKAADGSNEIVTIFYDHTFTEVSLAILAGTIFAAIASTAIVMDGYFDTSPAIPLFLVIMMTAIFALCSIIAMCIGLSLVRCCKARIIFKNSIIIRLLKKIFSFMGAVINGRGYTVRAIIIFVIYSICNVICILIMANWGFDFPSCIPWIGLQISLGIWLICDAYGMSKAVKAVDEISIGNVSYQIDTSNLMGQKKDFANRINHIGSGLNDAIATSVKDERLKAQLITNVSHDIKTPLTSIISYVDLLKREDIKDETILHYIDVLDQKSARLKTLTEDLVEASKVTTGNIELHCANLNFTELLDQAIGEFQDKYASKHLTVVTDMCENPPIIYADGQRTYRIIDNLLGNIYKYSAEGTRVYISLTADDEIMTLTLKNISDAPLNISPDELTERFTRGDQSRNTEGSGLGLSIAKELTILQDGTFNIHLDGDLFKVIVTFHIVSQTMDND